MADQRISSGLKTTFFIHFIITSVVGVQHVLAPRWWTDLAGMEITITVTWRIIGAAVIGFAVSSFLAYKAEFWEQVRIVVIMEIIWSVIAALVIIWGIFIEEVPPLEWLNVALLICFAFLFTFYFIKMRTNSRLAGENHTGNGGTL